MFTYREKKFDIFEYCENCPTASMRFLVHTVSGDLAMDAGIAKAIEQRYGIRSAIVMEESDQRGFKNQTYIYDRRTHQFKGDKGDHIAFSKPIGAIMVVDRYYWVMNLPQNGDGEVDMLPSFDVLSLVTKKQHHEKPTLDDMRIALTNLRDYIEGYFDYSCTGVELVMPTIGCGLNGLNWKDVNGLIFSIFSQQDGLTITVCLGEGQ